MTRGFSLFALFLWFLSPGIKAQETFKNVLIFFGDNETRPAYSRISEGIKSSFTDESGTKVNLIREYLDLERFSDSSHLLQLVEMYNYRVKTSSIDLVITVAPGAYDALRKSGLRLLHSVPVIALEMSPQDRQRYIPDTRVVELQIEWSPKISMAHVFSLFPETGRAYIIGGCSESDRMFSSRIFKDAEYFKDTHHFTFLSCVSIDSVLKVVRTLPESSLVFMASFATDVDNTPFSTALALSIISEQSRVPVFTMSDNFIDYGGIGGHIVSFTEVGKEAGRIALDLMSVDTLEGFTQTINSYYQHEYNWKELEKWGLLKSKAIPPNSTFYSKEFDFLWEYRWQITAISLFTLLQTLLISYLFRLIREQKKVNAQKIQNEVLYRQIVREERVSTMAILTASLSHELNQPLTAILFNTQAGLRFIKSGRLDESQSKSILSDIEGDVKRASGIISSVRSMMKLESRQKEPVEMVILINDVLQVLHSEINQHYVIVTHEFPEKDVKVFGDRIELQQVLINLLLNSVKAMNSIPPEKKNIMIKVKGVKDGVSIAIEDNGPGIAEDRKHNIFDPFITSHPEGMGIGLTLCKSIIIRHDGVIWAENRPEGGAVFTFTLPIFKRGK